MNLGPISDNMLAHIRECAKAERAEAFQAPAWQRAIDHRRWLLREVDRLRAELDAAWEQIELLKRDVDGQ